MGLCIVCLLDTLRVGHHVSHNYSTRCWSNLAVSTQCPDPNLTTADQGGLEALLRKLGLLVPVPSFAAADILSKPLDIGRSYLADILYNLEKCDRENAFNSIQISNDIESEDLMVRLPKVWPGDKFKEIGEKISFNVNMCHSVPDVLIHVRMQTYNNC
jgi:hypothetical protein